MLSHDRACSQNYRQWSKIPQKLPNFIDMKKYIDEVDLPSALFACCLPLVITLYTIIKFYTSSIYIFVFLKTSF